MKDKKEERGSHPGWAVRFSDGTWLGGAHGWFRTEDAFYADIYESKKDAEGYLKHVREDKHDAEYFALDAEIVPAWEPLCENLRLEISTLRSSCKLNIYDLNSSVDDIQYQLDELKRQLIY